MPVTESVSPNTATPQPSVNAPGLGGGDYLKVFGKFGQGSSIDRSTEEYLAEVKKYLRDMTLAVEIVPLARPEGSYAYIHGGYAIIAICLDNVSSLPVDNTPPNLGRFAAEALRTARPDTKLINVYYMMPRDYPRAKKFATVIHDALTCATDPEIINLSVNQLNGRTPTQYVVDTSLDAVREFVNRFNPQEVQPRIEFGAVVSIRETPTNGNRNNGSLYDQAKAILGVGGYTEIIKYVQNGVIKYIPVIRITANTSLLRSPAMTALGLCVATDRFILQPGWRSQFARFGANDENVGRLRIDPSDEGKGRLWTAKNIAERDQYIGNDFTPPVLALDIVDGVDRNNGLHLYAEAATNARAAERIIQSVNKFFGVKYVAGATATPPITNLLNVDYVGTIGDHANGGIVKDSRYMSYLNIVATAGAVDPDTQNIMLNYHQMPSLRAGVVSRYSPGFKAMSVCQTVQIRPEFVNYLSTMIKDHMSVTTLQPASGIISMDFVANSALGYQQQAPITFGMQGANYPGQNNGFYYGW